jgi:futalosine hydrolase
LPPARADRTLESTLRILIVTATELEVAPFAPALRTHPRHEIEVLVTGVGMVATAAQCARALARSRFDLALNVGVCGSFDPALPPATVVHVVRDRLAELGAEDGDAFLTLQDLHLGTDEVVNEQPPGNATLATLPAVSGITVNTVHGCDRTIGEIRRRLAPQVESMEGAAFMYASRLSGVAFAQVRAVSNVVERRNREAWRMQEAIAALGAVARNIVDTL